MGFRHITRSGADYGLPLILGGAETTLWDLAQVYSNLMARARDSNKNSLRQLNVIRKIDRVDPGKPSSISENNGTGNPNPVSQAAAWMTLEALLNVKRTEERSHWKKFKSSQKIAWKTGTSYGHRDAWAVGSSSGYTVAVWVGNATGEGRPDLVGSRIASPIMFDLFGVVPRSEWISPPYEKLKKIRVCKENGFLASNDCDTILVWSPNDSFFQRTSPHHKKIHLDKSEKFRVHSRCEMPLNMIHKTWFTLPAGQGHYFGNLNPGYKALPPWRDDCKRKMPESLASKEFELLYPNRGTRIYIPVDFGNQKGKSIFHALHRNEKAKLFWHIDGKYIGETTTFHEMGIQVSPGDHIVSLIDENGNKISRNFTVIGG